MYSDDDNVLSGLTNELELDSAIQRLRRIGFELTFSSKIHHLQRSNTTTTDDIFIEFNEQKQLIIQFARNAVLPSNIEVINTWDEWIIFVRLLSPRSVSN